MLRVDRLRLQVCRRILLLLLLLLEHLHPRLDQLADLLLGELFPLTQLIEKVCVLALDLPKLLQQLLVLRFKLLDLLRERLKLLDRPLKIRPMRQSDSLH